MHKIKYKGYDIEAKPYQSDDSSEWKIELLISKDLASREFYPRDILRTEEEAIKFCFDLGVRIIDGEVKECSVDDF